MFIWIHSLLRYPLYLLGLAVIGYTGWCLATHRPFDERLRKLGAWFALLMLVEVLAGFALIFTGRFAPITLTGHVFSMAFATAVAFVVPVVMRKRPPEERTLAPYIVGTLVSLVLLWVGLLSIGRPLFGGPG
ncbi:MAG TPA: hypothetical protein VGA70_13910 [Longimicrobiales bacterium]